MKKLFPAAVCILVLLYVLSCGKTKPAYGSQPCTDNPAVSDSNALLNFARQNGITTTADTSHLYYQIINPGTGVAPAANSKVYVRYGASLLSGIYFDSSAVSVRLPLDSLIKGWQYGLPKIKTGGQIKLLIPSALAYGCAGAGNAVPPNSPVYFNIYLDSLK